MSRQGYAYSTPAAPSRHSASHGTSSAFSSSANADEDWTQISDLAERRRIQNRIAQRNYRKKLKRRLEDLERRAGSSSASPPQVHAELKQAAKKQETKSTLKAPASSSQSQKPASAQPISYNQYTPPMQNEEEVFFANGFERDNTSPSPPLFTYQSYSASEDSSSYPSYPHMQAYRQSPGIHTAEAYPDYMVQAPMTLPSMMHFNDAVKREPLGGDDAMNPFSMSYDAMAGIEIPVSHGYESNPHTPPLSRSFETSMSGACSDGSYSNYPNTPLSMPPSPPQMGQY